MRDFIEHVYKEDLEYQSIGLKALSLERGVSVETLMEVGIFLAPTSEYMFQLGFHENLLPRVQSLNSSGRFKLAKRYVIPLYDFKGEIISLLGRVLKWEEGVPVYRELGLLTDSELKMPFLFPDTMRRIIEEKVVYITDGVWDAISLREKFGLNSMASLGSSFTDALKSILYFADRIIYVGDDDEAARKFFSILSRFRSRRDQMIFRSVGMGYKDFNLASQYLETNKKLQRKIKNNLNLLGGIV